MTNSKPAFFGDDIKIDVVTTRVPSDHLTIRTEPIGMAIRWERPWSAERLQTLIDRIELRNFLLRDLQMAARDKFGFLVLMLSYRVVERDSVDGLALSELIMTKEVPSDLDDEGMLDFVYATLRDALEHELAESWHVDGARVRDPHKARWGAP